MKFLWFLLLSGCMAAPVIKKMDVDTYQNKTPIILQANSFEIQETKEINPIPYIESSMPITPNEAIATMAKNRFKTSKNHTAKAYFIIHKANMMKINVAKEKWYQKANTIYTLNYQVELKIVKNNHILNSYNWQGYEKQSIPTSSSMQETKNLWQNMLNTMLFKLNSKFCQDIQ